MQSFFLNSGERFFLLFSLKIVHDHELRPWNVLGICRNLLLYHWLLREYQLSFFLCPESVAVKKIWFFIQELFKGGLIHEPLLGSCLISESIGRFSNCPKNVPKTILNYYIQYMAMIKYWFWIIYCKLKITIILKFSSKMQMILPMLNV